MIMSIFKLPLNIAKKSMASGDVKFNKSHRTYGNFNVKKDLNYICDDTSDHRLDIYTNPERRNNILLFYVHGGAYIYGQKEDHRVFISWFVEKGFDFVSINYRLGEKDGSVSVVDQVKDAFEALKFVEENKHHYGIKTDNVFLVGDSAGGHICMLLDILLKNKEMQDYYKIKDVPNIEIKGIGLNSTMYDYDSVIKMGIKHLTKSGRKWIFSNKYLDSEFVKINNPAYYYRNGYKPSSLFASSSYHDYFRSQTLKLKRECDELGIDLDYLFEASVNRKIGHVYNHFNFENEEGLRCNTRMKDYFLNHSSVAK